MKKYFFYSLLLAVTWVFVTGSATPQTFASGLILGLPIAYSFRRFYPGYVTVSCLKGLPYVFIYLLNFLKELLFSNIDVMYRVLHPALPVDEGIMEYHVDLDHPTAKAILANSITLTPGTLVIDHIEDGDYFLIHCLKLEEGKEQEGIEKWEKLLKKIFGEQK